MPSFGKLQDSEQQRDLGNKAKMSTRGGLSALVLGCLLALAWAPQVRAQGPEEESSEGTESAGDSMEGTTEGSGEGNDATMGEVFLAEDDDLLGHEEIPPPPGLEEPPPAPPELPEISAAPPPPPPPPPAEGPASDASTDTPIRVDLHGYYRARLVTIDSQPVPGSSGGRDATGSAAYGFSRLRLNPAILFGSDEDAPVAALRMQIDALDNVVFGDNARLAGTPLFANDPSRTSLIDGELDSWLNLRRLWLEFLIPVGQVRVGRMPSHGGMGLLFNDGNGFRNDFGDALDGTTFDRILFATRPLTIFNALTRNDSRPTPLIFAAAYDWLAEDTLGLGGDPVARRARPFEFVTGSADDVWQTTLVLAWKDEEFNSEVNARDEITAGVYAIHRAQDATGSNVYIGDAFYRLLWSAFGRGGPQIYSEAEVYTLQGNTYGVSLRSPTASLDPITGRTGEVLGANIWGGAARLGVVDPLYSVRVEGGFSTGQEGRPLPIGIETFTQRPSAAAYQVGLLLYPTVLAVRTANAYGDSASAIWSGGGVWNSWYLLPQVRLNPLPGLEIVGQFLVAFADQLNTPLTSQRAATDNTGCGLSEECLLGWEADLAVKVTWGPNDELRWSNELGIMNAGPALGPSLTSSFIWTAQTRMAFVF